MNNIEERVTQPSDRMGYLIVSQPLSLYLRRYSLLRRLLYILSLVKERTLNLLLMVFSYLVSPPITYKPCYLLLHLELQAYSSPS